MIIFLAGFLTGFSFIGFLIIGVIAHAQRRIKRHGIRQGATYTGSLPMESDTTDSTSGRARTVAGAP